MDRTEDEKILMPPLAVPPRHGLGKLTARGERKSLTMGTFDSEREARMKTDTQAKQDRTAKQNGQYPDRFFLEPIPVKLFALVIRRRRTERYFREQNAMLGYVLPVNGHNESAQPAGPNNNGQTESKPLVVDRHGQDNLPIDYSPMWTIWK